MPSKNRLKKEITFLRATAHCVFVHVCSQLRCTQAKIPQLRKVATTVEEASHGAVLLPIVSHDSALRLLLSQSASPEENKI